MRSGTPEQRRQFCDLLGFHISTDAVVEGFKGTERDYVRLRGVPFVATPENIVEFFGDLKSGIAHQGVHMVLNAVVGVVTEQWVWFYEGECCQLAMV